MLKKRYENFIAANTKFIECNIVIIHFEDNLFVSVVCLGGLCYRENTKVLNQIHRALKKNGVFIFIDSLDNNLIYKTNRFVHFLKKKEL